MQNSQNHRVHVFMRPAASARTASGTCCRLIGRGWVFCLPFSDSSILSPLLSLIPLLLTSSTLWLCCCWRHPLGQDVIYLLVPCWVPIWGTGWNDTRRWYPGEEVYVCDLMCETYFFYIVYRTYSTLCFQTASLSLVLSPLICGVWMWLWLVTYIHK